MRKSTFRQLSDFKCIFLFIVGEVKIICAFVTFSADPILGLVAGATILLFDGNPGYPDLNTLWRYAEREKATFYGTGPTFISLCRVC